MNKNILIIPHSWPNFMFQEQIDLFTDKYDINIIFGKQLSLSKKKALRQIINRKFNQIKVTYDRINVIEYMYVNKLPKFLMHIQWILLMKAFNKLIDCIYNGNKPDLIHIYALSDTAMFIHDWAKKNNIPIILSEHLLFTRQRFDNLQKTKEKVIENVELLLCTSNYQYRNLLTNGISLKNVEVIGNFVNDNYLPKYFKKISNDKKIIFVARHLADKDIDIFLEAISILRNKGFRDIQIDILGIEPDDEYLINNKSINLKDIIEERELFDNIQFKGYINHKDLLLSYQKYSFLVSSSISETFGLGVAEALMNGLPVVCTDSGGIRDFVDQTNGIIVPIRSSEKLANAIIEMINNRYKYDSKTISNGIRSMFGKDIFRANILNIYDKLLK